MKVYQTKNYDQFVSNPLQREFKEHHVQDLAEKMRQDGYRQTSIISVSKLASGKLQLNTGHHRVPAARIAGVPVYYVIEHPWTAEEMVREGTSQKVWPLLAAARAYAFSGNKHYQTLISYVALGIPVRFAASLLVGQHSDSHNVMPKIKAGSFKVKNTSIIDEVVRVVDALKESAPEAKSQTFVAALSALLMVDDFNSDQLIHKINLFPTALQKAKTRDQMLEQLEEIYNRSSRFKDNIAFKAKEALRQRSATNHGK